MDFKVSTKVRVRFVDVDYMGHVNHANFFTYMEQARLAYFKNIPELNFMAQVPQPRISVILASVKCDYLAPVYMDQEIEIKIRISSLGRSSIKMEYLLEEVESKKPVAKGESTVVMFDYEKQKTMEIPQTLKEQIQKIEEKTF